MIGTQRTLGVGPPGSALLFVIASPVGPYFPTGFKAVSLEATDYAVRAWPGGVGDKKLGANYAPCIVPQLEAARKGFHQNLWLFGEEEFVTEVGTMNFFAAIKNRETGRKELVTAPLDGTILEGVTRDSILALARERLEPEGWVVSERKMTMRELAEAADESRLLEAFGAGTAAIVSPVRRIGWKGRMVDCGLREDQEAGEIAVKFKDWIERIQYGEDEHPWRYVLLSANIFLSFALQPLKDRENCHCRRLIETSGTLAATLSNNDTTRTPLPEESVRFGGRSGSCSSSPHFPS